MACFEYLPQRVAFVRVETALHADNGRAVEESENQSPGMAEHYHVHKAKRPSWNSGKPHGQNAHPKENLKQNLSPATRHEDAPVSTQELCFVWKKIF